MPALAEHPASALARCAVHAIAHPGIRAARAIGPLGVPFDPFAMTDPAAAYRVLHANPGVHPVGRRAFALAGYDDVRSGARANDALRSGQGVTMLAAPLPMLLTLDEPRHGELRRLLAPQFTARRGATLETMMRELATSAIERMLKRPGADAVAELAVPLPITVIASLLGIPHTDLDRFRQWSDGVVDGFHAGGRHVVQATRSVGAVLGLHRYMLDVFARLRREPGDDVISALLASREGGSISDGELFWLSLMLLVAGNETTTNLIGSLLFALARDPDTYQRLRAEPERIDAAIEEGVRWSSPIQHLWRVADADYTVGATTIPAGSRVALLFGAANRDPRKYADPDVFDIERNPTDHVGFGSGIHHCLGARLARQEARIVLEELTSRVKHLRLLGTTEWRDNPAVHGPRQLLMKLEG